jgi:predicted peptidase
MVFYPIGSIPENVDSRDDWPLIVFLYGRGERGTDLNLVLKHALPIIYIQQIWHSGMRICTHGF